MKTDHPSNRPSPSNSRYGSPMGNGKMLRKTSTGPSPIQVFPLVLLVCWSLILGSATIYSNLTKKLPKQCPITIHVCICGELSIGSTNQKLIEIF